MGGEIRKLGGDDRRRFLSRASSVSASDTLASMPASATRAFARFGANGFFFGDQACNRLFGVGSKALFPLGIGSELNEPKVKLDNAVLRPRFFAVKILAGQR